MNRSILFPVLFVLCFLGVAGTAFVVRNSRAVGAAFESVVPGFTSRRSPILDPEARRIARFERARGELAAATTDLERFYALGDAAKESFEAGLLEDAERFAKELEDLAPRFAGNWNHGNAVHDVHVVLGRLALSRDLIDEAREHLLAAGRTEGSPQLNSFGPNTSLARDLLERGEDEVVLEYFDLCAQFWTLGTGDLRKWRRAVRGGRIPDFGANLIY